MKRTRALGEHISSSQHLRRLRARADELAAATTVLREALGTALGAHCAVGRVSSAEVVVIADGAHWATRARFAEPRIAAAFAEHWGVKHPPRVRVHVDPPRIRPAPARPPTPPSPDSARLLESLADGMTGSDERLGAVLRRLATRAGKRN